jgi:hypothetical protein
MDTIGEGKPSPHEDILINVEAFRGAIRKGTWKLIKVALLVIRRAKTGHSSAPKTGHHVGGIEQKNRLVRSCWQGA